MSDNPIEIPERNLIVARMELENACAMHHNTPLQAYNRLMMIESKAQGVAHAAHILSLHHRQSPEGVVMR